VNEESTGGESPATREGPAPARPSSAPRMTRRDALGRLTAGAVVAGAGAWVVPEILIARPTAAGALSTPHIGTTGTTGGIPGEPPTGDPFNTGTTPGVTNPQISSPTVPSVTAPSPIVPLPSTSANPSSSGTSGSTPATSSGSGHQLAFTGASLLQEAQIGTAMVVGGWALTRWSSRAAQPKPADDGDAATPSE